jgi:hypothetical protein
MDPMNAPPALRRMPDSRIGRQLYHLLPAVYRDRDNSSPAELGDLGKYLDACGELLDRVRATLDQRLADSFPDNPPAGERACQEWLLPYFAELVDARLVSPDARGRRDEVARAVDWRQRKGTLAGLVEIAASVGVTEVEIQEGWKRVALTPRVDAPLLPPEIYGVRGTREVAGGGSENRFDPRWPGHAARHPGLPAATVDFRVHSGAVRTGAADPAARVTSFAGQTHRWRQANPHGVPCAPGSHKDVSRRTVDVRTPDWARGHAHPRRVLLFTPPPRGFFGDLELEEIAGDVALAEGRLDAARVGGSVVVTGPGVVIDGCAIQELIVSAPAGGAGSPGVIVRNSLLGSVRTDAPDGVAPLVEMEYCTVLGSAAFGRLNASDCIFAGPLAVARPSPSCVRYSRIPRETPPVLARRFGATTNTDDAPIFQDFLSCDDERLVRRAARFGEPGCGVLHPATPESVRLGAEDGGEMGAYHARAYALRMRAVLDKLADFLPVGMEAVLIPDPYLLEAPADTDEADQ